MEKTEQMIEQHINPFYSILVSACEVAPYVPELIRSLKAQTFPDFEVLLICEESKDGTHDALLRESSGDPRFRVIPMPRSGSASAGRNYGIEHSRGKYLVFVDGDDSLDPDALRQFHAAIAQYGELDLLAATTRMEQELGTPGKAGSVLLRHPIECGKVMTGAEALKILLPRHFQPATWRQIYRGALLRDHPDLRQAPGRRHQDEEWTPRVFTAAEKFVSLPFEFYHYRKRANSVTTQANPKSMTDCADNLRDFIAFWNSEKCPAEVRGELASWYCDLFFRFFHTQYCLPYDRGLRRREFQRIFPTPEEFSAYRKMAKQATFSKRILVPLFALARRSAPGFLIGEWVFRFLYWPLLIGVWGTIRRKMR